MTKKVYVSTYAIVVTVLGLAVLAGVMCVQVYRGNLTMAYIIAGLIVVLCGSALFYSPLQISLNDTELEICRPLRCKSIPLSDIASVELCAPTMGEKRIFGSGGWFGYYGWFHERDLGKYFAYYGKASDCFFVRLKDGRNYMLGCDDPQAVVDYIKARMA